MGKRLLLMFVLFFAVGLGLVLLPVGTASAQLTSEAGLCGDGIDNDKDGFTDCQDPDCATDPKCVKVPPPSGNCSPGFWKNHPEDFAAACGDAAALAASLGITRLDTCVELGIAVACKGADATCLRSVAAGLLNTVSGCQE
jgi:hypothetical protein